MQNSIQASITEALQHLATSSIDQGWLDEADAILRHLQAIDHAPLSLGLLHVWMLSQAGRTPDALAECERLSRNHPDADGVQPLLAVLRYAQGDPTWRGLCEQLVESERCGAEARTLAQSLLSGTFGTAAANDRDSTNSRSASNTMDIMNFNAMSSFLRA